MPSRPKAWRPARQETAEQAERRYDAERRAATETRRLYSTARWRAVRDDQLKGEPLCRMCLEVGIRTLANTCDHVEPHRGDVDKFWGGPFQSLCGPCHNSAKQAEEAAARG